MQRIKLLGLTLVAALALSVVSVSSASASSFLAHPTGNIVGTQTNTQLFNVNAGTVECTTAAIAGTVTVLKSLHQLVHVTYSGCKAFGTAVTISTALYLFSADLKVSVQNDIIITSKTGSCWLLVGPTGNQNLNSVHYANEGADLKVNAKVTSITYTSTGGICGAGGANGTYNGEARVSSAVAGGSVRWDKE
jgi:hypothetical protein